MTTSLPLVLCALALGVPGEKAVADPDVEQATGHVLVLDNERTFEGDIEKVGDQYRIRHAGGETSIPRAKVLRLCQDLPEAYRYLRARTNLNDPDERLRLAQWCHLHQLREQAFVEVKAAAALRPDHAQTRWLLAKLQESGKVEEASRESAPNALGDGDALLTPIDLNAESLSQFVVKIQPILMNTCAHCHGANYSGSFRVVRVHDAGPANRRSTQHNVAAVLNQVNFAQPTASLFLIKAATAHGDMTQPLFKSRETPAYRTLEEWVASTVKAHPQLQERLVKKTSPTSQDGKVVSEPSAAREARATVEPKAGVEPKEQFAAAQPGKPAPGPSEPAPIAGGVEPRSAPGLSPNRPAAPVDEFDPVIFNRQMHPGKK